MVKILRTFNIDDDVAHMLRFKHKNQSRYVNTLLRSRLFVKDNYASKITLAETPPHIIVSRCYMYTETKWIIHALDELMKEVEKNA